MGVLIIFSIKYDPKNKSAEISLHDIDIKATKAVRSALFGTGKMLRKHCRENLKRGKRSGVEVRARDKDGKRRGVRFNRSAPDEWPQRDSGDLRGANDSSNTGINFTVTGSEKLEFGSQVFYGVFLEEGTSKMAARPFLSRSIEEKTSDINKLWDNEFKKELT